MTGVPTTADPTRVRAVSRVLAPRFVLAVIWSAILIGVVTISGWALPLFWALMALTGFSTFLVLLGAKPLPAMSERSHLFLRLSWLARYGTATAVLCLSTFLGALAGFQAGTADAQATLDGVGGMLGAVGIWAAKIAAVLFFGWLVIDVHRMSKARRRKGIRRGIRKIVPKEFRAWVMHEAVTNWFLALSSRVHATVSLGAIVISLLMALRAPGN